ncbi:hypothetical protein [Ruegeria sp. HKCCD8929]|uniref:hypothetical protein n=1 Tax=Ruegeria sp. HKCCD8929 TaxID=2683006 RepID=UPI001488918F|nr:hypothetical protein [Ruegeria sp. HKCCD8929]
MMRLGRLLPSIASCAVILGAMLASLFVSGRAQPNIDKPIAVSDEPVEPRADRVVNAQDDESELPISTTHVVEAPLFSPTRQPIKSNPPDTEMLISTPLPPESSEENEEALELRSPPVRPNVRLSGIKFEGEAASALISTDKEAESHWREVGYTFEGWKLTKINRNSVTFGADRQEFTVHLFE